MTVPLRWQSRATPVVAQQIRQLAVQVQIADRVAPLSGHALQALEHDRDGDEFLLVTQAGQLTGVVIRRPGEPAELFVDNNFRRQGIGTRLLDAALGSVGKVWAHGNLPAARALAASHGLVVTRTLLQMRRPLPAEPMAPLPHGVRLRTFVAGQDEQQFLDVNARAFAWHPEQGQLAAAGLAADMAQPWFDPAGFFLAVDPDDVVLGFHWTKIHPVDPTPQRGPGPDSDSGPGAGIGEVYVLAVDPQAGVHGLGAPLTAAGLTYLADAGLPTVMLYVEGDNQRALSLYQRFGFTTAVTDVVFSAAGGR